MERKATGRLHRKSPKEFGRDAWAARFTNLCLAFGETLLRTGFVMASYYDDDIFGLFFSDYLKSLWLL